MAIGLYARVSTSSEEQLGALEQQRARLAAATRPLQKGRTRLLTGLLRCAGCDRRMQALRSAGTATAPGIVYWRCRCPACPIRRPGNAVRESDAISLACAALMAHSQEIAQHMATRSAVSEMAPDPKVAALMKRIEELRALEDDELEQVIAAKEAQLARLLVAAVDGPGIEDFAARMQAAFAGGETLFWLAEHSPILLRSILQDYIEVMVVDRGVMVELIVKPIIRVAGSDGKLAIRVRGL